MGLFQRDALGRSLRRALGTVEPPTFPELHLRILRELRRPDATLEHIGEALRWDPALALRLLQTVNSSRFGPAAEITSTAHAAAMLGRAPLEHLITGLAVGAALPAPSLPSFCLRRFWHTSARRAILARSAAEALDPSARHEAFTAGLLQDLALPILVHLRPADYARVLERWHAEPGSVLHRIEDELLGFDHAQVGAALADRWGLPETLSTAIAEHNAPLEQAACTVSRSVRLASGLREEADPRREREDMVARAELLGLCPDAWSESLEQAEREAGELSRSMFPPRAAA